MRTFPAIRQMYLTIRVSIGFGNALLNAQVLAKTLPLIAVVLVVQFL